MAEDVNLGSVGFGLISNTEGLERSLTLLTAFGERVNRAISSSNELTAAWARQQSQIEKSLTTQFDKIAGVSDRLQKLGTEGSQALQSLNKNYEQLTQTVTRGDLHPPQNLARGFAGMSASIAQATRAAKDQEDQVKRTLTQQQALFQAQQKVGGMTAGFGVKGAPAEFSVQATAALAQYETALSRGTLNATQLQTANQTLAASLNQTSQAFKVQAATVNQTSTAQLSFARQQQAVLAANQRAGRLGVDLSLLMANETALKNYGNALQNLGRQAQASSLIGLQASLHATRLAMTDATRAGTGLSNFMDNFNRATILAAGPLSGFGARVAVMSHLLSETTAKMAFLIAGVVGLGYAFTKIGIHAVRSSMDMEKFNALLVTSSGAAALSGEEYEYLLGQANKLGQSVQGLVQPYTQFATAARLSGMTLEVQRSIFEGFLTAGTALRWDTEKTGRAFLAIEQMISKGTVQMQEMKLQLGQVLPGAMELAAAAIGKTTGEFNKMMSAGEVIPNELLPKLSDLLKKVFGAGALEGARTLQAEFARLATATFSFNLAFDKTVGISEAVRAIVIALAQAMNYLAANMREVVAITAGLLGGLVGLGAAASLIPVWNTLGRTITAVRVAFTEFALIASFVGGAGLVSSLGRWLGAGGWVGLLVKLVATIGGAIIAYKAFKEEVVTSTGAAIASTEDFLKKSQTWIENVDEIGFAHKRTAEKMREATLQNLQNILMEIEANRSLLAAVNVVENARTRGRPSRQHGVMPSRQVGTDPEVEAMRERLAKEDELLQGQVDRLQANITKMGGMKLWDPQTGKAEKDAKRWENFLDTIRKLVESGEKWREKLTAITTLDEEAAKDAIDVAEAWEKTAIVMERFKDLKSPKTAELVKVLKDANVWTGNLQTSLLLLHYGIQISETAFKSMQDTLTKQKRASEDTADAFDKMTTKLATARRVFAGANPEEIRNQEQLSETVRKITNDFRAQGIAQEQINFMVEQYTKMWNEERGIQKDTDKIKELQREIEKIGSSAVLQRDKAWKEYAKTLSTIAEAQQGVAGKQLIDEQQAMALREQASKDLYEKLWLHADDFNKKLRQVLMDMEKDLSDSWADWTMGNAGSWKDMLNRMERDLLSFGNRILVVKPLFNYLFGDLVKSSSETPTKSLGVVGNWLQGLGVSLGPAIGNSSLAADMLSSGFPGMGAMLSGIMHGGGTVGQASVSRMVPAIAFQGAIRAHAGLLSDEVPIIAKREESVLTPDQMRTLSSKGGSRSVTVHAPINIYATDAGSFHHNRNKVLTDIYTTMRRATARTT